MALNLDSVNYNVWKPLKSLSLNGLVDCSLLLNHGVSVDTTSNDVRTPLTATASNGHLDVTGELLSNGGSVHIEGQHYWQQLVVDTWKFSVNSLNNSIVWLLHFKKCSELTNVAAQKAT
jgi:ankyrin repeat protein